MGAGGDENSRPRPEGSRDGARKGREKFRKPPFLPRPIAPPRHDRGVGAPNGASRDEDGGTIMLRIRTGARHGLRGGMFGFVAALFTISGGPSHAAPYADIVVDANSGTVLHSTNPDAQRHPASLTKIMTLYLLFEQLEAGKLKLDSPLPGLEGGRGTDADQARPQARQHARGRRRHQGHGHAFGQRCRRGGRGSDRRR